MSLLPKAVLRPPPRGGKKKRYVIDALISSCLCCWQDDDLQAVWLGTGGSSLRVQHLLDVNSGITTPFSSVVYLSSLPF